MSGLKKVLNMSNSSLGNIEVKMKAGGNIFVLNLVIIMGPFKIELFYFILLYSSLVYV